VSSVGYLGAIHAIERLYESVVTNPENWNEQAFSDWAADTLADAGQMSRDAVREIRRCLRSAQKLRRFWMDDETAVSDHGDWRSRVDIALGARAWRPLLDLARSGLEAVPSEELFAEVKDRFAVVYSERWMEGISFEEWMNNN
jgi:hypothetical protein